MKKKHIRKLITKIVHKHSRELVPSIVDCLVQYTDKCIGDIDNRLRINARLSNTKNTEPATALSAKDVPDLFKVRLKRDLHVRGKYELHVAKALVNKRKVLPASVKTRNVTRIGYISTNMDGTYTCKSSSGWLWFRSSEIGSQFSLEEILDHVDTKLFHMFSDKPKSEKHHE